MSSTAVPPTRVAIGIRRTDRLLQQPFSWFDNIDALSIYGSAEELNAGVYLCTVPFPSGYLIYYVGDTGRSFRARLRLHYLNHFAAWYHVYSAVEFARGEKVMLWPGPWDVMDRKSKEECRANRPRLGEQIREMAGVLRFFLAPLSCDQRVRRRIEAAIAKLLNDTPGNVGMFQDKGIDYQPRRRDEEAIECIASSPMPLLGLPERVFGVGVQYMQDDSEPRVEMTMDELREFVRTSRWKFARTMPHMPHEYTLRAAAPDEKLFERVVLYIRQAGYKANSAPPLIPTLMLTAGSTGRWERRLDPPEGTTQTSTLSLLIEPHCAANGSLAQRRRSPRWCTLKNDRKTVPAQSPQTATHLLRAGVGINTIRAWLGHVSLETTNFYAETDLSMKARALAACDIGACSGLARAKWREDPGIMAFLQIGRA